LKKDQYENSYTVVHDICYEKVVRKIQWYQQQEKLFFPGENVLL
jgi:hypothetical protein